MNSIEIETGSKLKEFLSVLINKAQKMEIPRRNRYLLNVCQDSRISENFIFRTIFICLIYFTFFIFSNKPMLLIISRVLEKNA